MGGQIRIQIQIRSHIVLPSLHFVWQAARAKIY